MTPEEIDKFVDYFWTSLHPEIFIEELKKSNQQIIYNQDRTIKNII